MNETIEDYCKQNNITMEYLKGLIRSKKSSEIQSGMSRLSMAMTDRKEDADFSLKKFNLEKRRMEILENLYETQIKPEIDEMESNLAAKIDHHGSDIVGWNGKFFDGRVVYSKKQACDRIEQNPVNYTDTKWLNHSILPPDRMYEVDYRRWKNVNFTTLESKDVIGLKGLVYKIEIGIKPSIYTFGEKQLIESYSFQLIVEFLGESIVGLFSPMRNRNVEFSTMDVFIDDIANYFLDCMSSVFPRLQ
jgi:hypothetical protein